MSDTADRYATREEIENAFRQCRIAVAALAAIRFNLEHLPLPWALDPLILSAQDVYEVEPGCTALAVAMRPIVERRQHGDFYPFPEPLGDAERAEYATLLASHRKTIERIRDEAETQLDILGQSLLHAESEMPEFRFMGREFRWGFDAILDAGAFLVVWIRAAQVYLDSSSDALREKLTAYPIPTTSQEWKSLGPHLRIEESRLLRDWATLAPLVPSMGVVTRSPSAIDAPSSPPAIAAAADAPSADPAADEETKADPQSWGPWSRYMAKQDIENELNSGCWRTLTRNAGKHGISYDLEMHPENSKQARFRRRLSPPS